MAINVNLRTSIKSVTIPTTGLSPVIDLEDYQLFAFEMPAAWTAANLTFQGSSDGVTFKDLYDGYGSEISLTVAANRIVVPDLSVLATVRYIKIRSGTSAAVVAQAADRVIKIIAKLAG